MNTALSITIQLAEEIDNCPLSDCGPSDDPDKQTAYLYGFRDIAKRFIASAKRIDDPIIFSMLKNIDDSPEVITDAYNLRADLLGVIDYLREIADNSDYQMKVNHNAEFLNTEVLYELKLIKSNTFDTIKLVKFCEELNDSYARGNYLSCSLVIRAVMNHIPPIFNEITFSQVVSKSGRSIKKVIELLEDQARPIADLHTHQLVRKKEQLPSKHQIEPYKSSFEILIQEIIVKLDVNTG
jgi:hypothetical protein